MHVLHMLSSVKTDDQCPAVPQTLEINTPSVAAAGQAAVAPGRDTEGFWTKIGKAKEAIQLPACLSFIKEPLSPHLLFRPLKN